MAKYFHLNIYKKAFDFLIYYTNVLVNFRRRYKYTIGENILNKIVDFIVLIYLANDAKNESLRLKFLNKMNLGLQYITVLLRLCHETQDIAHEKYSKLVEFMEDIEGQLNGWITYTAKQLAKKTQEAPDNHEPLDDDEMAVMHLD